MKTHTFSSSTRNLRVRCVPRKGRVFFRRVTNLSGIDRRTNQWKNKWTDRHLDQRTDQQMDDHNLFWGCIVASKKGSVDHPIHRRTWFLNFWPKTKQNLQRGKLRFRGWRKKMQSLRVLKYKDLSSFPSIFVSLHPYFPSSFPPFWCDYASVKLIV